MPLVVPDQCPCRLAERTGRVRPVAPKIRWRSVRSLETPAPITLWLLGGESDEFVAFDATHGDLKICKGSCASMLPFLACLASSSALR